MNDEILTLIRLNSYNLAIGEEEAAWHTDFFFFPFGIASICHILHPRP